MWATKRNTSPEPWSTGSLDGRDAAEAKVVQLEADEEAAGVGALLEEVHLQERTLLTTPPLQHT